MANEKDSLPSSGRSCAAFAGRIKFLEAAPIGWLLFALDSA